MYSKIVGISGSIRSLHKHTDELNQILSHVDNQDDLNKAIKSSDLKFSNTDVAVAHALLGAKTNGFDIEFVSINNLFKRKHVSLFEGDKGDQEMEEIDTLHVDFDRFHELVDKIVESSGVVFGTPVYFGDRSSVANKFLQLTNKHKVLHDKALGVVSVGAKRNGGQETTNIYVLYEGLMQDCIVVGNGPSVAQYGGTLVGGDRLDILTDDFGQKTAFGTGKQVATLAKVLEAGGSNYSSSSEKVHVCVVVTMDTPSRKYREMVSEYFERQNFGPDVEVEYLELVDETIYRCIACDVCPSPFHRSKHKDMDSPYNCIVQAKSDGMKNIQRTLQRSDAIVLVGVNTDDDLLYRYQAFMERTRYIRREDFELTNKVVVGLNINEIGARNNPIHNIKVLTSIIRHNTFIIRPMDLFRINGEFVKEESFQKHIELIRKIRVGRKCLPPSTVSYEATGYANKELDHTSNARQ